MKKGKQLMKSAAGSVTPQVTRLAVLALALTAVLGAPVSAQSVDSPNSGLDAAINRSAPARPAAKPAAPARTNNAARPAAAAARPAAAQPKASRPAEPSRPAAAHPNAARPEAARNATHPNAPHSNTAHSSRPEARHEAANRDHRGTGDRGGEHAARRGDHPARGAEHGRPATRNASFHHGENLHGGHRIPEDRFRGSFGQDHQFHIGQPVMIGGQASFQFGGFWFGIVDPWPAAWLYTDAVYVDFVDGGYVLVNVAHPEVTVAVSAGDAVTNCAADPSVPAAPVVAAPIVAVPVVVAAVPYPYFTWHYWRHFWR